MRKNELIHLHGLFAELRKETVASHESPSGAFREYEAHGVGPNQIHRRKEAHNRAIQYLGLGILRTLADEEEEALDRPRQVAVPDSRS